VATMQSEIERLKRELARTVRATSPPPSVNMLERMGSPIGNKSNGYGGLNEGKENHFPPPLQPSYNSVYSNPASPRMSRYGGGLASPVSEMPPPSSSSTTSSAYGAGNGAFGSSSSYGANTSANASVNAGGQGAQGGAESWKRAAEVTQNLKARIEMMKAKQGLSSGKR